MICTSFTVYAGDLDASRCWKEAVPAFPTPQARRLQESEAPIVVKWVVAGFVVAIDRDTLETVDGPACGPEKSHSFINESRNSNSGQEYERERERENFRKLPQQSRISRACKILRSGLRETLISSRKKTRSRRSISRLKTRAAPGRAIFTENCTNYTSRVNGLSSKRGCAIQLLILLAREIRADRPPD